MDDEKRRMNISRRQFLKTAGVGVAAAGLGSIGGSLVAKEILKNGNLTTGMATGSTENADYYVSPTGNDSNEGTSSNPLASLHEAVNRVSEGQTIVVRGGEYQHEHGNPVIIDGKSGSSSNPIKVITPQGETPHLKWEGGYTDWDIQGGIKFANGASHWVVEGLEVSQCPSLAISSSDSSDNLTFRNIHVHDNSNSGFQLRGTNQRIINSRSTNNYDEPNGGEDADGLVMSGVDGGLIENCVCEGNADDGIDLWESSNITVRNTICRNNGIDSNGDKNGIKSANTSSGGNNTFIRCIAHGNGKHGIRTYSPEGDTVINCTSYNNADHGYAAIEGGDHEILNCIEYENESDYSFHDGVSDGSNSWNQGIDDPQFQSTDPASDNFLKLSDGSPAIDAGITTGQTEHSGNAPDLGAHEKGMNTVIGITDQSTTGITSGGSTSDGGSTDGSSGDGDSDTTSSGTSDSSTCIDPEEAGWADMDWFRQAAEDGSLQVVKVTSTDPSELKSAINTSGPTLVVFEVGGVFDFGGPHFTATEGQTYIAGQTAPEPGVHITKTSFAIGADDFVMEHVAIRPGDEVDSPGQADGITTESNTSNIIINHCSVGWSIDENITVDNGSSNVTVANSFFSHTLFDSTHPEGEHSMGFMVDTGVNNISGVGNLVANHEWRSPRHAGTGHLYWTNNYAYNFVSRGIGLREEAEATIIGNYYEKGGKNDKSTVLHDSTVTLYVDPDNINESNTPSFEGDGQAEGEVVSSPIQEPSGFSPLPASETKKHVLDNSGMRPEQRPEYDTRLVQNIRSGNSSLIDSQSEVGGYPDYSQTQRALSPPQNQSEIINWLDQYSREVEGQSCTTGSGNSGGTSGGTGTTQPSQPIAEDWTPIVLEGGSSNPQEYMIKADQLQQGDGQTGTVFEGQAAAGSVEGGSHHYQYKGRLYDITTDQEITIKINGENMTPQKLFQKLCSENSRNQNFS